MSSEDQRPPWGNKKKPESSEELAEQLIKKLQDFFSDSKKSNQKDNKGNSPPLSRPLDNIGRPILFIVIFIVFQGIYLSFFKISPSEVGVVLRLGKYQRTTTSGLHFKIPYVDALYKVDTETIRKEEFGFRSATIMQQSNNSKKGYEIESLMLTADKNVINVAWIVQYKVNDPYAFLFKVQNVPQALRDASESVTRRVVGNMDFDYVLSYREILAEEVKKELQVLLNKLEAGVSLVTVQFQDINPPDPVKPAFNEVNEADQDMKRLVNEAQETYNRIIPKASGDAKKIIQEAHGYAVARINDAKGETGRFLDILKEYSNAPEVTRRRVYIETMQDILPDVQSVYVLDKENRSPLPLLNLNGRSTDLSLQTK